MATQHFWRGFALISRLLLSVLLFAAGLHAQTLDDIVVDKTHSSIYVTMEFSSERTGEGIDYGETGGYGQQATIADGRCERNAAFVTCKVAGLAPAVEYHFRGFADGPITGSDQTVTTLAEPSPHPALPTEVSLPTPIAPTIDGDTYTVASGDCGHASQGLQYYYDNLSGSLNHEIVIPSGTDCYRFEATARGSHTGELLIRSDDVGTATFPPVGVRLTEDWPWEDITATIYSLSPGHQNQYAIGSVPTAACDAFGATGQGGFVRVTDFSGDAFQVLRCNDDNSPYSGNVEIPGMSGDDPVTVTAPGHTLHAGAVVDIPDVGYVTAQRYIVLSVSGDDFTIPASTISAFTSADDMTVYEMWEYPTYSSGSDDPAGACTDEHWYQDTTAADALANWWCAGSVWTPRDMPGTGSSHEAAALIEGDDIYFKGIAFEIQPVPNESGNGPTGWDHCPNGTCYQGTIGNIVYIDGADNLTFDQCFFNGRGKPAKHLVGVNIQGGDSISFLNSSAVGWANWWGEIADGGQTGGGLFIDHFHGNQFLFYNNYVQYAGIGHITDKSVLTGNQVEDVQLERNTWNNAAATHRQTLTQLDEYTNRNAVEFKSGTSATIKGNRFTNLYSNLTAGQAILITPKVQTTLWSGSITGFDTGEITLDTSVCAEVGDVVKISGTSTNHDGLQRVASQTSCTVFELDGSFTGSGSTGTAAIVASGRTTSDIYAGYNTLESGTEFMRFAGEDAGATKREQMTGMRVLAEHNLMWNVDVRSYANAGNVDSPKSARFGCYMFYVLGGWEDVTLRHNTMYGCQGNSPGFLYGGTVNEGLKADNNLFQFTHASWDEPIRIDGTNPDGPANGEAALDGLSQRYGVGTWAADNNVICCGISSVSGDYPASFGWPADDDAVDWWNPAVSGGNFRLRYDSAFISGGASPATDGRDVGADVDLVEATQGRVSNLRVSGIATDEATVSYLAPDADVCTVEVSTSETWGTGARTGDGGGDRVRNVEVGSLTTDTVYNVRVLCMAEQPSTTFRTH